MSKSLPLKLDDLGLIPKFMMEEENKLRSCRLTFAHFVACTCLYDLSHINTIYIHTNREVEKAGKASIYL